MKIINYVHKCISLIQLHKYTIRVSEADPDIFELKPNEPGLLEFQIRAKDAQSMEFIRQAWLKDINEMKGHDGMFLFFFSFIISFF